ncbi:MAG: hypothetical protein IRZ14_01900 [Chloroflexi bacterium]|nr:hypothetical protein [Chloroflexota bacterium]
MKIYRGYSDSLHGLGPCIVVVQDATGWWPLARISNDSVDGWGWGYGGPGAADLARSILADHLGYAVPRAVWARFVWEVVGRWAQGWRWVYTSADLAAWLASAQRRGVIPALPEPAGETGPPLP